MKLIQFLKDVEGFIGKAHDIGDGVVTVGYGLVNTASEGKEVTEEQAEQDLAHRLAKIEIPFMRDVILTGAKIYFSPNQKIALASLIFNVGRRAFLKSKAWKALQAGDVETFKVEAFDPKIGFLTRNPDLLKGIQNRRKKELDLFNSKECHGD